MSYTIFLKQTDFYIPAEKVQDALIDLKAYAIKHQNMSWINSDNVVSARTLKDALCECGWEIELDLAGNVCDINFIQEKGGSEIEFFGAIAEYVALGSYIQVYDDVGDHWRWVFDGKTCTRVYPEMKWEFEPTVEQVEKALDWIELAATDANERFKETYDTMIFALMYLRKRIK